jgi:diguanylate cyclase (GGDEF)-like protein
MLRTIDDGWSRGRHELEVLHRISLALAQAASFDAAAKILAHQVVHAVDRANECTISVWQPDHNRIETAAVFYQDGSLTDGSDGEFNGELYSLEARPESRSLLENGAGYSELRVTDLSLLPQFRREFEEWTWRSVIELPLVTAGRSIGLMDVADYDSARGWARRDVALLQMVATLAAMVVRVSLFEDLEHRVDHDSLTELLNHRAFYSRITAELARAHRIGEQLAVLVLDLDDFKQANDSLGHLAGDAILRQTAAALRSCCRPYDVAGRIGGDEFAMILTGPVVGAETAARRILRAVEAMAGCGASIGVASSLPGELDPLAVMGRADAALLQAKRSGKHRVLLAA